MKEIKVFRKFCESIIEKANCQEMCPYEKRCSTIFGDAIPKSDKEFSLITGMLNQKLLNVTCSFSVEGEEHVVQFSKKGGKLIIDVTGKEGFHEELSIYKLKEESPRPTIVGNILIPWGFIENVLNMSKVYNVKTDQE